MRDVVQRIADRTSLNEGEIVLVLFELRDTITYFNRMGMGARLEGLGTYLLNINYAGEVDVKYFMDAGLKQSLNWPRIGPTIINRQNIGKSVDEIVALWNAEHPDGPVE
jgi:hypothetical protein